MSVPSNDAAARLRLLYEVTSLRAGTAASRLAAALEAVTRALSLDNGVVTRIEGGTNTIAYVYSAGGVLRQGQSSPLEQTYSNLTLQAGGVLSINTMAASPYASHPFYRLSGYESYIGAAVTVNGALYGTLEFSGLTPRNVPFMMADEEMVEMLARWVGVALEAQTAEVRRRESESRFATLFYASPVPVILTTLAEGRLLDLNAKAELALGFSREEAVGRTTLELGIWSERPFGGRRGILRLLEGQGRLRDVEMVLRRRDGGSREVLASFEVLEEQGEPGLLTTLVDLTERKRMERQLQASEARFRSAFHDAAIGMAMTALDGRFLEVNASVCKMLGYPREELLALGYRQVTHPEDLDANVRSVEELCSGEVETFQMEKRYLHREGHVVWGHVLVSAVRDDEGRVVYFVSQVQDITVRKHYEEQIKVMAYCDELTGLHNRRYFFEHAPEKLAFARQASLPVALIYLDLNGFKEVNDTLGHQTGDELLQQVAARLKRALREEDLFARFGGDEFAVLLFNATDDEAQGAAARLAASVKRPFHLLGTPLQVGVSVGVVVAPRGANDINDLLKYADRAMYRAKERKASVPCAIEVVRLGAPQGMN